mmetsp:Transcript_20142/g.47043  ORF Transcript_20142/g.47043 Transcript_20142/m.47043 type:complete len:223 (-) Transcript_20142:10090-10758(-)
MMSKSVPVFPPIESSDWYATTQRLFTVDPSTYAYPATAGFMSTPLSRIALSLSTVDVSQVAPRSKERVTRRSQSPPISVTALELTVSARHTTTAVRLRPEYAAALWGTSKATRGSTSTRVDEGRVWGSLSHDQPPSGLRDHIRSVTPSSPPTLFVQTTMRLPDASAAIETASGVAGRVNKSGESSWCISGRTPVYVVLPVTARSAGLEAKAAVVPSMVVRTA